VIAWDWFLNQTSSDDVIGELTGNVDFRLRILAPQSQSMVQSMDVILDQSYSDHRENIMKKADAAKHPEVFHRVGLLTNQPLGTDRVAFYSVFRCCRDPSLDSSLLCIG
jgi:hypothetical protein